MRVVDDVGWLKDKLDQLDNPARNDQQQPEEGDIIATAFAARGLLEAIEKVNVRRYNHTLRTNIRTIRFESDAQGSSEIVYHRNKCISLKYFCGAIIHLRNFTYNFRSDGKHWLDVINDRTDRYQVFYSDFTSALRSLILSRRLVVLALCDLAEEGFSKDMGPPSFSAMSLDWLLHQHLAEEDQLKLDILRQIFGIENVPAGVLPTLSFSRRTCEPDNQIAIEFDPPWENGQDVASPPIRQAVLFSLIRHFYEESNSRLRVFN